MIGYASAPLAVSWLEGTALAGLSLLQWLLLAALVGVGLLAGFLVSWLVGFLHRGLFARTSPEWDEKVVAAFQGPIRFLVLCAVVALGSRSLRLTPAAQAGLDLALRMLSLAALTWLAVRLLEAFGQVLRAYLLSQAQSDSRRRAIETQVAVPLRLLEAVVVLLGLGLVAFQLEAIRAVGWSLLASAGLAGIVVGLAAQRTVGNFLCGLQLAFLQPIRLGDAVVVENEFGFVEEIGLTFVVVRIWDRRSLILPVSYFLDRPFVNCSLNTDDLLGTVTLPTDFGVPVDELRQEVKSILDETDLWDGKVQNVQVTDASPSAVEVRVLVSAATPGELWDLRCQVRERLVEWLQTRGQEYLPVQRLVSSGSRAAPLAADEEGNGHDHEEAAPPDPGKKGKPARSRRRRDGQAE